MDTSVDEFKEYLNNLEIYNPQEHDDNLLRRFLKARQGNLELAAEMLKNNLEWRKEQKMDTICDFEFTEYKEYMHLLPRSHHRTDKFGRPIQIRCYQNLDIDKVEKITTSERMLRNHIQEDEKYAKYRFPACTLKKGELIDKQVVIMDVKGFPFLQFHRVMDVLRAAAKASQDNYPESVARIIVVNAPFIFSSVWALAKRILPQETIDKVTICGSGFLDELLEIIDIDNLPKFLGGNCECPGGCENADIGPWNDGTVQGFPSQPWETVKTRYLA